MKIIFKNSFLNKIFKIYGLFIYYWVLRKTEFFTPTEKYNFQFKRVKKSLLDAKKNTLLC